MGVGERLVALGRVAPGPNGDDPNGVARFAALPPFERPSRPLGSTVRPVWLLAWGGLSFWATVVQLLTFDCLSDILLS